LLIVIKMKGSINKEIEIPSGVTLSYVEKVIIAKGPKGQVEKKIFFPNINVQIEDGKITMSCVSGGKKEKMLIGTFSSHIRNLIKGSVEGYTYKLKICSGHFPMNVSVTKGKFIVKNLLGEKIPRELLLKEGASVKIDGHEITVESTNKEIAGQVAADIEKLSRRNNFDRRIFQDGIYITEKDGKKI